MSETLVTLPFRGLSKGAILAISDQQLQLLLNGDVITYPASTDEYNQTGDDIQRAVWYCGHFWRVVIINGLVGGVRLYNDVPDYVEKPYGFISKQDAKAMARRIAIEYVKNAPFRCPPDYLEDAELYEAFDEAIKSGKISFDEPQQTQTQQG
jgi:hypothetical protein